MIIISEDLVLGVSEETNPNSPLIGYQNLLTINNVVVSSENPDFPVVNLANVITAPIARWEANDDGPQTITVTVNSIEDIDYVAIARHNLGSTQRPIIIEGASTGEILVQETLLPDDAPAIFRFTPQSISTLNFSIGESNLGSGSDPASIAIMYIGKLLPLQRRIYVGHTPIKYGRSQNIINGKTEAGDFLGRIVISEQNGTTVDLQNLTPSWYRSSLDPFIKASKEVPFFFAWRPGDYPNEVGFAWMTNDPQPSNQRPNGMMQISLQMTGIAP